MADILMAVISYKNSKLTEQAINALCHQTIPVDVVLWDNDSPPMDKQYLQRMSTPDNVMKVFSADNLLWTPAINRLMMRFYGGQSFIGYMNNDIILPKDSLEKMLETAAIAEVGMVGPVGYGLGGQQDFLVHQNRMRNLDKWQVSCLLGACCLMRRSVWDAVGPLDESMPLGADDFDYSIRVKDAGYQLWAQINVLADHKAHSSGQSDQWGRWGAASWQAFDKKWDHYYRTEREALLCMWDHTYTPGWDVGTGWCSDQARKAIYDMRESLHKENLKLDHYLKIYKSMDWDGGF